jgi:hypothetical protein
MLRVSEKLPWSKRDKPLWPKTLPYNEQTNVNQGEL